MNYLAHLYLADDSPESIIGNLLGDFLKGQSTESYCDEIRKGIRLHKNIDVYTDSHPIVRESKRLISPVNRRYAGILVDVFYDHFLAKNWLNYSLVPLQEFTFKVYEILQSYQTILPDSLKRGLPNLVKNNLLMSYAEVSGISFALQRLSMRLKRKNDLGKAVDDLTDKYECFEVNFDYFFPELIDYVKALR